MAMATLLMIRPAHRYLAVSMDGSRRGRAGHVGQSYKLLSPGFVLLRPVPPNTRLTQRWREWGRNPTPPIAAIGLSHASDVRAPQSTFDAGHDAGYPMNFRAQQIIDGSKGERHEPHR